jgi:hypothetical protein
MITGNELEGIRNMLIELMQVPWTKLGIAALENLTKVDSFLENNKVKDLPPEWNDYKKEKIQILKSLAILEDGKPLVKNNAYVIDPDKEEECKEKLAKLDEQYSDLVKNIEKQRADIKLIMESDANIDLTKINISEMPDNMSGASIDLMLTCSFMIIDDKKLDGE